MKLHREDQVFYKCCITCTRVYFLAMVIQLVQVFSKQIAFASLETGGKYSYTVFSKFPSYLRDFEVRKPEFSSVASSNL